MDQAGFIRRRIVARTLMFGRPQNVTSMLENMNAIALNKTSAGAGGAFAVGGSPGNPDWRCLETCCQADPSMDYDAEEIIGINRDTASLLPRT